MARGREEDEEGKEKRRWEGNSLFPLYNFGMYHVCVYWCDCHLVCYMTVQRTFQNTIHQSLPVYYFVLAFGFVFHIV